MMEDDLRIMHDFGVAMRGVAMRPVRGIGTALRYAALAVFAVMFLIGFVGWFGVLVEYKEHSLTDYYAAQQAGWWWQWVIAMFGIGLVDIAHSLTAIRKSKGTAP